MRETWIIIRYLINLLLFIGARTSEPLRQFKQQKNILFLFYMMITTFYMILLEVRIMFESPELSTYYQVSMKLQLDKILTDVDALN